MTARPVGTGPMSMMMPPRPGLLAACLLLATAAPSAIAQQVRIGNLPAQASQGAMVIGRVVPGSEVRVAARKLRVDDEGRFVFGIGRDEKGPVTVRIQSPGGAPAQTVDMLISPRDWPIQRINGVPPSTVNPPAAIAKRIARENGQIVAARGDDSANTDFSVAFVWPVKGRISGRFGNQRVFNGTPKSPHSGMDIAAAQGTPIRAPAGGRITLSEKNFYLTGGTVMIDHGHGISSNFLHMSRLDVKVGDVVKQGDVVGLVGSTGRSTGPHLHWGMTWFDTKIDPLLVLEASK